MSDIRPNHRPTLPTTRATTLIEMLATLRNAPLTTSAELQAFYRGDVNAVRGSDFVDKVGLQLNVAWKGVRFRSFLMGRSGVGKSTEVSQLLRKLSTKYYPVRFSATDELNPNDFRPFDVLLLMIIRVAEETKKRIDKDPPEDALQKVWDWFAKETAVRTKESKFNLELAAGIKTDDSLVQKVFGAFGNWKNEIRYTSGRKVDIVEYRLERLTDLTLLANDFINACNDMLINHCDREWLFVGEDFDKTNIPPEVTEKLFVANAGLFTQLDTHFIFSIPLSLAYSIKGRDLPFISKSAVLDTPVYRQDHSEHTEGRAALEEIVLARADDNLFEPGVLRHLIVASGGNVRDLFTLCTESALEAAMRDPDSRITVADTRKPIAVLRTNYEMLLGTSPHDSEKFPLSEKVARLIDVYNGDPSLKAPGELDYSLLRAGAIQEFNGTHWYGVHPLIVDFLKQQVFMEGDERRPALAPDAPGGTG